MSPNLSEGLLNLVVGIADLKVGRGTNQTITTHALGSCIGLTIYDPSTAVGGLLHFMLPAPRDEAHASTRGPAMFASTGVPVLFTEAYRQGASKERLIVCAAGAAELMMSDSDFQIGRRNRTMMRKLFWKNGVTLAAEDLGGADARTLSLDLSDGTVRVRTRLGESILWKR